MPKHTPRGYAAIGLQNPKNALNVGSALRAAACYGAAMVAVGGPRNKYRRAPTDTSAAFRHIPLLQVDDLHMVVPFDCVPVAVDLVEGATPLCEYRHPERAFYVFGPEDGTLGESVLPWCQDRVYVPTRYCMNLAATVNVILYDRLAKTGDVLVSQNQDGMEIQPRRGWAHLGGGSITTFEGPAGLDSLRMES